MNYFIYAQQNQPILEVQNQKGYIYQLRNEQYIDSALTRYEGEMEDQKRRILCDRLQNYTDELMRCLNELIENPQENILNYMDFFIDPYTRHLFIIYEYVEKEYNALDSARKLQFCNDIAKGIYHLHQICYRHRNVNPENIFYINGKFKLANLKNVVHFVMSEQLDFVGDSDYWSQELFQGLEQDHTIDIFAFACTLFEVFTKEKLFSNQHNDRQRIPQDKKQKLQEIPSNVQRFINQVIEENQRDLKLFLVDQALDKKQTQHPGNSVQKQFQFQTNQLFINNNNDNNNKMKQTLPSFNQTNQIRPQTATLQSTIQNQIGTFKLPFQVKQPDPQLNTFQQQMPQQPQSNQYVQQQQQQNQQFQQQFQQKSQQPFQQQQFQQQSFQQSQTFKQGPISQPKFKILDKPFSQGNQQQQQFFPNAPQPSNQQQFQQQVQVFDTYQVEEVNQKKNDIQQNDLQQFNPNQQEQKNEEDFQNQQSNKKENEVENFKIMILNQIQKIVKYEQIENILQNTIQLKNENQDFSIEHILSKIITRKVRNSLGIQSDQIV